MYYVYKAYLSNKRLPNALLIEVKALDVAILAEAAGAAVTWLLETGVPVLLGSRT